MKKHQTLRGLIFTIVAIQLSLAISGTVIAENRADRVISGTVTDEDGAVLPGVNVILKGTLVGVVTDASGKYSLQIPGEPSNNEVLVFSFIGYATQEVAVSNRTTVDVTMITDITSLSEVVVVGYGTQDKKDITTTVTHLTSKDILQVAGNGALMAIQGKVAGLSITNTAAADPNSSPNFQLRGVSSRNAGLGPLFVINGIPGGNIDNLNQNDIESIDVLKGGAASAIYGTRGSNGVVLITTKRGASTPQAFYDGYVSFNYLTNKIDVLSKDDFLKHNRGTDYGGDTDWAKAITKSPAISHKHTLQLSGGSNSTNYMLSFDYRDADGLDLRSAREEYGARLNLYHKSANDLYEATVTIAPRYVFADNASVGLSSQSLAMRSDNSNGAFTQSLFLNPTFPVYDETAPSRYFNVLNKGGFDGAYNPAEELNTVQTGSEGKYLEWSASFKLNILKNLYSQITLGQQTSDFFDFNFTPSTNNRRINSNGGRNTAGRAYNKTDQKTFEWIGNYNFDVNDHDVEVMGGYSFNYFNSSGMNASNEQFPSDVLTYHNLGTGTWILESPQNRLGSYKNDSRLIAFFGRITYDYASRYYVSASLRREGSSRFGAGNKWGSFPGVSVGWRIINESFFPKIDAIEDLKLRADFGVTGNQDFGNYLSLDTYSGYGFYAYQNTYYQVWGPSQNINTDLRWEKAENFNVGLDFELFESKISGTVNYFSRTNKDLLGFYNVPVPPNVQGQTYVNVGTMKNSGVEIQLDAQAYTSDKFQYTISFAGATNNNKFISFSNDLYKGNNYQDIAGLGGMGSSGLNAQRLEEGRRIGSFYMWKSAGVDATGRLLVYDKAGEVIPANTAKADDRRYVGNGLPKFTAGLGNNFSYGSFTLSVFLRGAFGFDLYNTTAYFIGTPATQKGVNVLSTAYDGGKYSALTNEETYSSLSDYFLEKGDYVKIDNVTLSYNFSAPVKFISSARVYFTGRNLYTFTKFTGGDPELVNVNGLSPGINTSLAYYPSSLQLIAGLQLKF
ncbi:SusC/RagA family TonB-linked outer membrane protein [Pseudochryseolinea flava]|uniref:SusC/RagA family TonB-linked outer membrane protein n=1 Tax=Pseudochryseolinea flava TaxID=2059302 RepID=A0A364XVF0_9BACT|nr:SusC/RagA family TonB-linked outer membrane protein [Pseudochryseolinea flava]RAV98141.1 SusC/RagA family TonB-linked outer membrane protein [Pseudochryseolinea flava]